MIHIGDCLEVMRALPERSIDSFVTDPPYGIGFMGKEWDKALPDPAVWREALRISKPGTQGIVFGGTRLYHRVGCQIEDAGWEIRDCGSWLYGSGFPKSRNVDDDHGTALKPAWEPWYLIRAPFKGTIEECYREYGTGVLNISACRIEAPDARAKPSPNAGSRYMGLLNGGEVSAPEPRDTGVTDAGRWPANVILDEEAAAWLDVQTGTLRSGSARAGAPRGENQLFGRVDGSGTFESDIVANKGGASRFFYVPKPSQTEREAGLEDFVARIVNDGRKTAIDNAYLRGETLRRNIHPTVKPIELMRYLVRLVTPPGGVVLDAFMGSGTTGCAAALESRRFVGIEMDPAFAAIARARIAFWSGERAPAAPAPMPTPPDPRQPSLFDALEVV